MIVCIGPVVDVKCCRSRRSPHSVHGHHPEILPVDEFPPFFVDPASELLLCNSHNPQGRAFGTRLGGISGCQRPLNLCVVFEDTLNELSSTVVVCGAVALEFTKLSYSMNTSRLAELKIHSSFGVVLEDVLLCPDLMAVRTLHILCDLSLCPSFPAAIPCRRVYRLCLSGKPCVDKVNRCVRHCQVDVDQSAIQSGSSVYNEEWRLTFRKRHRVVLITQCPPCVGCQLRGP